jgi:hypothetical protein
MQPILIATRCIMLTPKITVPQPKIGNQPSSVLTAMSNAPPLI